VPCSPLLRLKMDAAIPRHSGCWAALQRNLGRINLHSAGGPLHGAKVTISVQLRQYGCGRATVRPRQLSQLLDVAAHTDGEIPPGQTFRHAFGGTETGTRWRHEPTLAVTLVVCETGPGRPTTGLTSRHTENVINFFFMARVVLKIDNEELLLLVLHRLLLPVLPGG
jgi:hypothetical protein